jgi:hypothetical protein
MLYFHISNFNRVNVNLSFVIPFEESASLVYSLVCMVLRMINERNAFHYVFIMKGNYEYVIIYNLLHKFQQRSRETRLKGANKKDLIRFILMSCIIYLMMMSVVQTI